MSDEMKEEKPRLIGMFTSPREQFERIRKQPLIWGAMGIIIFLYIVGMYLASLGIEVNELDGSGIDGQMAQVLNLFVLIGLIVGGIILPIISVLFNSFIYWLIAKIFQSEGASVSFRTLFSMNTYILVISALGLIVSGIIIAFFGGSAITPPTSLAAIIGNENSVLLNQLEIFAIWNVILTAIGLQVAARFSKGLAWSTSIGLFILGILLSMAGDTMSSIIN